MYKYIILGSGMQGTAAGYDLLKFGNTKELIMADIDENKAKKSAERLNKLSNSNLVKAIKIDAKKDEKLLVEQLKTCDSCLSALPYFMNPRIAELCIETKTNMNDLGGNTDVVKKELELDQKAKDAGISIVPDCGLMPGMGNTIACYLMDHLDSTEEVQIRCGGLPQNPKPPLDYMLLFYIGGLTNEYFGKAYILENYKIKEIDTFAELENINFPKPIGDCEAFTTTGGTSTCPWTFENKIKTYEYKTVRYKGHYEKFKTMMDLGLLDLKPVKVGEQMVVPRDLFHKVAEPRLTFEGDKDLVVLRVFIKGVKNDKEEKLQIDIIDYFDDKTGFTSMERTTAFPATIVTILQTENKVNKGAIPLELAVDGKLFMKELDKRDIKYEFRKL